MKHLDQCAEKIESLLLKLLSSLHPQDLGINALASPRVDFSPDFQRDDEKGMVEGA
jgi:hypothetical protein